MCQKVQLQRMVCVTHLYHLSFFLKKKFNVLSYLSNIGPSAGITMATSLLSLALSKSIDPTVAMTGELTLTGKVLKIGGLREKAVAAKRSGVTTLIYPDANISDWEELPNNVKEGLKGIPVGWYDDVFKVVFTDITKEYAAKMWLNMIKTETKVIDSEKEKVVDVAGL
jgi:ATP-dependent Lon protease